MCTEVVVNIMGDLATFLMQDTFSITKGNATAIYTNVFRTGIKITFNHTYMLQCKCS